MSNKIDSAIRLDDFQKRIQIAAWFVMLCLCLLFLRFFWLQVIMHKKYSTASESNRIAIITTPAQRGLIIDRNGIVIANNMPSYSLEVTPSDINTSPSELIEALDSVIKIPSRDKQQFLRSIQNIKKTHNYIKKSIHLFHIMQIIQLHK